MPPKNHRMHHNVHTGFSFVPFHIFSSHILQSLVATPLEHLASSIRIFFLSLTCSEMRVVAPMHSYLWLDVVPFFHLVYFKKFNCIKSDSDFDIKYYFLQYRSEYSSIHSSEYVASLIQSFIVSIVFLSLLFTFIHKLSRPIADTILLNAFTRK